jgi:hypothetical protein
MRRKTFFTEVLLVDWQQTQSLPKNDRVPRKTNYDGPIHLMVDGHAIHVTPRVLAYAASQQ